MRGTVAERRRANFDIPAPLLRVCSHIRGRICHFFRTMMVWSARFRSGRGKLGVGPISCGADFAPAPPPLRDCACVNACNDLCWSQFSACLRPRMCERTLWGGHFGDVLLNHQGIRLVQKRCKFIKYIPENIHTVLLCFVLLGLYRNNTQQSMICVHISWDVL